MPAWERERKRRRETMPQIIVKADGGSEQGEGAVMLRERISSSDFESETFAARLVERLGWAVDDAHAMESAATEGERADYASDATATPPAPAATETQPPARIVTAAP
jgi:hypothetical protein